MKIPSSSRIAIPFASKRWLDQSNEMIIENEKMSKKYTVSHFKET
jgi:hypothetical protein